MTAQRWAVITLILLLGAFGRIYHINEQSLWVDEGYAFYHAHFPSLVETLARDTHPPLYFVTLRLWSELAGQSELALRWLSVLPSMLSLAVIYQLAKEVIRQRQPLDSNIPILAVLMLALADAENFLAGEARHYTWLVLLVSCSMLFFLRWSRNHQRQDYGIWVMFTTLMVYTHYITAFIGITQGLYALFILRRKIRLQALAGLIASALLLAPWLLIVGSRQLGNDGANWSVPLSSAVIRDIQVKYFTEQWTLVIGLLLLGCVTILYHNRESFKIKVHQVTVLLVLWLIVPILLTIIVNEFLPFLQPRRLTQWTPVIALLVAFGLANIQQPIRSLLILILLVYGVVQTDFYRVKPDWRTVAELTARYVDEDDLVLTDISGGDYQMQYYLTRQMPEGRLLDDAVRYESLKVQRDFYPDDYHQWLPNLLSGYDTVWLMYWSNDTSARGWLDNLGFEQSAEFVYVHDGGVSGDINMSIFRFDRHENNQPIVTFENGMTLLSADFDRDDLRLDTLWTHDSLLERDYTISAKLLNADGVLIGQFDSQPQLNQRPTTTWSEGEIIYSPHELILSNDLDSLPDGNYQLAVQIYYHDGEKLVNVLSDTGEELILLESIEFRE